MGDFNIFFLTFGIAPKVTKILVRCKSNKLSFQTERFTISPSTPANSSGPVSLYFEVGECL